MEGSLLNGVYNNPHFVENRMFETNVLLLGYIHLNPLPNSRQHTAPQRARHDGGSFSWCRGCCLLSYGVLYEFNEHLCVC